MVRQSELKIAKAKLVATRDAAIAAANDVFVASKASAESDYATAVGATDVELARIAEKLAGLAELEA
jgi:hypothetical protein